MVLTQKVGLPQHLVTLLTQKVLVHRLTVQDHTLNVAEDKVVTYFLDPATGESKIKRFDVSNAIPYPDVVSAPYEVIKLEETTPLWEDGSLLAQRDPDGVFKRKIFTYLDKKKDGVLIRKNKF